MTSGSNRRRLGAGLVVAVVGLGALAFFIDRSAQRSEDGKALPSRPTNNIVVIATAEGILGWWDGRAWIQAHAGTDAPVVGGEVFRVVRLDGPISTRRVSAPGDSTCGPNDVPGIGIDFERSADGRGRVMQPVAVGGSHNLLPRRVDSLSASSVYREAAMRVLPGLGIEDRQPTVAQVVRADLDGDGVDEVLVVAEHISDPRTLFAETGDYSVVFTRRVDDGQVRTTVIAKSSAALQAEDATRFVQRFRVAAIADLNGDGLMEVAVRYSYYEGSGTSVHEVGDHGNLRKVLSVGCGA